MRHQLLTEFPVVLPLPVQWGEQDAFGHVNNTVYFRWCESARIAYLERVGLQASMDETRIGPILAHIGCNFRQPVMYPDEVEIGTRIMRIGNSSFDMEHRIISGRLGVVADAKSTLVVYDYATAKSSPIPATIRAAIEALEGRAF